MPTDLTKTAASRDRDVFPRWIVAWFWLDAVVALAPPFYWAANGDTRPVLGVPLALAYFLVVGLCITASVVAAYLTAPRMGDAA